VGRRRGAQGLRLISLAGLPSFGQPREARTPEQTWAEPIGLRTESLSHQIAKVASGSYLAGMRAVGLKMLKNKLSEYVRLAASGETVLVTDRDHVVAEIVPPQAGRDAFLGDAMLADAVRRGWVTPPTLVAANVPPRKPVMRFRDLMAELDQDRDDR
jgi:antitoxin (DNA-binding transcriptional repressor) of toxin-antitoxin stability system